MDKIREIMEMFNITPGGLLGVVVFIILFVFLMFIMHNDEDDTNY